MKHKGNMSSRRNSKKRIILIIILITLIFGALSGSYLYYAWDRHQKIKESEVLRLSESIISLLHSEHIAALSPEQSIEEEQLVKETFVQLVNTSDTIYYAYLLKYQDGILKVILDSATDESEAAQIRLGSEEIAQLYREPFEEGQSVITKAVSDSSGKWIRVLAPIYDNSGKNIIAVLGLVYSAEEWNSYILQRMIPDFHISFFLLILVIMLISIRRKNCKLATTANRLALQEALYRNTFEQAPVGIVLQGIKENLKDYEIVSINPMGEQILGLSFEELKNTDMSELARLNDFEMPQFENLANGDKNSFSMEKRLVRSDGTTTWTNITVAGVDGSPIYKSMYVCLIEDISKRKESEESLTESERSKSVFFSHLPGMAYRCKNDKDWTIEFVSNGCYELTGFTAESLINNRDISFNQIISPAYRNIVRAEWEKVILERKHYHQEYEIITKAGERKWVLERGRAIYNADGNVEVLEGIILDISKQKQKEMQITYLKEHDFLTGLYNRNRMEEEKNRLDKPEFLPLSFVVCDIDGLRVINDAYGYDEGDRLIIKTARLIKSCITGAYALCHEGGGNFSILLPGTDNKAAYKLKANIISAIESYNRANTNALYTVSVSIGHSTKESEGEKLSDVSREAEVYLKQRKLLNRQSSHSSIVSAIMATLYAKSQETEQHGQRLELICRLLGAKLELNQKDIDALRLLSKLHDIGKIGIDDSILNKPGKLNENEWTIMKQHPEIGYRIAKSTPQLEYIAEYILYHHERWDGKGYPQGIKGEEIPVVSRILAIADAYDAMTEDRIYRKAMSHQAAREEIKKNAGTQFDPDIARVFIELISTWDNGKQDG